MHFRREGLLSFGKVKRTFWSDALNNLYYFVMLQLENTDGHTEKIIRN